jgi:hypothetical protein
MDATRLGGNSLEAGQLWKQSKDGGQKLPSQGTKIEVVGSGLPFRHQRLLAGEGG